MCGNVIVVDNRVKSGGLDGGSFPSGSDGLQFLQRRVVV